MQIDGAARPFTPTNPVGISGGKYRAAWPTLRWTFRVTGSSVSGIRLRRKNIARRFSRSCQQNSPCLPGFGKRLVWIMLGNQRAENAIFRQMPDFLPSCVKNGGVHVNVARSRPRPEDFCGGVSMLYGAAVAPSESLAARFLRSVISM